MAHQKGAARKGPKGFYAVLAGVAIVGLVALGYAVKGGGAATEPVELTGMDDLSTLVQTAQGVAIGKPEAPVKMLVFSDFQCPYCGQFAAQVKPLLEANEVAQGKLHIVFYDFPLGGGHRHSFIAARAARCAGDQGKFWEYHDLLYGQQSRWSPKASTPMSDFEDYAGRLGLDVAAFKGCVNSDKYADVVTANRMLGLQLGVNGTPTVIVNGKRVARPLDYEFVSSMIAREAGA